MRVILDGISGPLLVDGVEWNTTMPGQRANEAFSDEAIAGLVTWLRRRWEHRGAPVSPETVAGIRAATRGRSLPWTDRQLEALAPETSDRTDLFDGKTLAGWRTLGGKASYRAEDGCIVGRTVPNTPNTFLCTERTFGNFELTYEFKIDPQLNSGVQIRSHTGEDGIVRGYQIEIDVDPEKSRNWTAGLYEEGGRGWLADLSKNPEARAAAKPRDWNRVRVLAEGGRIRTYINDVPAVDLVDQGATEGFIGLQVHGVGNRKEPLEVRWRELRLRELGSR